MLFVVAIAVALAGYLLFARLRWRWSLPVDPSAPTVAERDPGHVPPVPSGWIPVLGSHEIRRGEVKQIRALGRLFVLFRGESGQVAATDPFCPHLGANLGLGSVSGDCLRCPFHGWQFDAGGACTLIPYTTRLPVKAKRARLGTHPVVEGDGFVWVWHDAEGREPTWTPDELQPPGRLDASWQLRLSAHVQDLMENQADFAHAGVVHGDLVRGLHFIVLPSEVTVAPGDRLGLRWADRERWPLPAPTPDQGDWRLMRRASRAGASAADVNAHVAKLRALERGPAFRERLPASEPRGEEMTVAHIGRLIFLGLFSVRAYVVIRQVGPCFFKIRMFPRLFGRWLRLPVTVAMAATPTGTLDLDVRVAATTERWWLPPLVAKLTLGFFYLIGRQDFRIWNSKRWLPAPLYVEGDGDIPEFRRWYARFYPASTPASAGEATARGAQASGK